MKDKDTHLLEETYADKVFRASRNASPAAKEVRKKLNMPEAKKKKDSIPWTVDDYAAIARRDSKSTYKAPRKKVEEEFDDFDIGPQSDEQQPEPEIRERPGGSHAFDIARKIFHDKDIGFEEMVDLHYTADGIVAVMEHEDGNQYTIHIKVGSLHEPRVIERK